jgi:8-oxo-dGTP pyrophosphatase MutT (NUDIX family)
MRLPELFETRDVNHAAGCIFFARNSRRFLLSHRSEDVEQPGTWTSYGGTIEKGEDPLTAVKREVHEETGYGGAIDFKPLFVFNSGAFRYSNFLAIVPHEFTPVINWETQGFQWCKFGKWPQPLHFGMRAILNDPNSMKLMHDFVVS